MSYKYLSSFCIFKMEEKGRRKTRLYVIGHPWPPFYSPMPEFQPPPAHCCCVPLHEANLPRVNVASITFCHKPLIPSQISSLEVSFWTPQANLAAAPLGAQHLSDLWAVLTHHTALISLLTCPSAWTGSSCRTGTLSYSPHTPTTWYST